MLSCRILHILFSVSIFHNICILNNVKIVYLFFNKFLTVLKVYSRSVIIMGELRSRSVMNPKGTWVLIQQGGGARECQSIIWVFFSLKNTWK